MDSAPSVGAWHSVCLPSLTERVLLVKGELDNFVSGTVVVLKRPKYSAIRTE